MKIVLCDIFHPQASSYVRTALQDGYVVEVEGNTYVIHVLQYDAACDVNGEKFWRARKPLAKD